MDWKQVLRTLWSCWVIDRFVGGLWERSARCRLLPARPAEFFGDDAAPGHSGAHRQTATHFTDCPATFEHCPGPPGLVQLDRHLPATRSSATSGLVAHHTGSGSP